MNKFPLYENLSKKIKKKDLTAKAKKEFIEYVKNINQEASELIYVLIRCYQQDKNVDINIKNTENKIVMNLDSFPIELKQILYNFIILNKNKLDEDKKIENNINSSI
jgi:hypothetical protein